MTRQQQHAIITRQITSLSEDLDIALLYGQSEEALADTIRAQMFDLNTRRFALELARGGLNGEATT